MKRTYPIINDITTTPDAPPQFLTKAQEYPKRFAPIQKAAYPDLAPLKTTMTAKSAFEKVAQVAAAMKGWKVIQHDPKRLAIQAVSITPLLRFRDDVIIEIRSENDSTFIHMRSKSRLGRSDFGANAKRIRAFLAELEKSKE